MADVRSMLRSELASRGSNKQNTSTGSRVTKKRKFEVDEDPVRKKSRQIPDRSLEKGLSGNEEDIDDQGTAGEADVYNDEAGPELPPDEEGESNLLRDSSDSNAGLAQAQSSKQDPTKLQPTNTVDEDEWAAFERDVVAPTRTVPQTHNAVIAAATISAAPVSAEELASQQRKEKEQLARAREANAEEEKEDAARLLEDEFEEMEQLEERVKRLKEMRERLRSGEVSASANSDDKTVDVPSLEDRAQNPDDGMDSDEEDEEDEEWDDWRFR